MVHPRGLPQQLIPQDGLLSWGEYPRPCRHPRRRPHLSFLLAVCRPASIHEPATTSANPTQFRRKQKQEDGTFARRHSIAVVYLYTDPSAVYSPDPSPDPSLSSLHTYTTLNIPAVKKQKSNHHETNRHDVEHTFFSATMEENGAGVEGCCSRRMRRRKKKSIVSFRCFYATRGGKKKARDRQCPSGPTQKEMVQRHLRGSARRKKSDERGKPHPCSRASRGTCVGGVLSRVGSDRVRRPACVMVRRRIPEIPAWSRTHQGLPVRARRPMHDLERNVHGRRGGAHVLLLLHFVATALDRDTKANLCLLLRQG